VQGVASSNPAAPTNQIKDLGQPLGWPFCCFWPYLEKVPNKVPNKFQTYELDRQGDITEAAHYLHVSRPSIIKESFIQSAFGEYPQNDWPMIIIRSR
jgi:hypothetical protein